MITFWIVAVLLIATALVLVVPPLLSKSHAQREGRVALNVEVYEDRLAELRVEQADSGMSDEEFQRARRELERDLILDVGDDAEAVTETKADDKRRLSPVVVALFVPLIAVGMYLGIGDPEFIENSPVRADGKPATAEELAARFEKRMAEQPDDAEGWKVLGRMYLQLKRYGDAVAAFEKAHGISGDEQEVLVEHAEALAMLNDGHLVGRPLALIDRALELNPRQPKALWLRGMAEFRQGETESAIARWRKVAEVYPKGSENRKVVEEAIAVAEGRSPLGAQAAGANPGAKVTVRVSLADELRGQASPDDAVYVFARATDGAAAPLAVARIRVKDLPATVVLDDSMAMVETRRISAFPQVTVGARVSKSGDARIAEGDLQGFLSTVKVGGEEVLDLVIRETVSGG